MNFQEQILDLIAIKKPCIQIRTSLEKEVVPTLLNILYSNDIDTIYRIDELDKVEKLSISKEGTIIKTAVEDEQFGPVQFNPVMLLSFIRQQLNNQDAEKCAFLFMDYDSTFDRPTFRRWIKDIFELKNEKYAPFIFVSSQPSIPDDINHLFSVVYYDRPTQEEIVELLVTYQELKGVLIEDEYALAHKFIGFNRSEIIECLDYSFYKYNKIDDSYIKQKRIEVIKKSSVIVYKEPRITMEDIAGNHYFKEWYEELKYCFEPDAQQYGVARPNDFAVPAGPNAK